MELDFVFGTEEEYQREMRKFTLLKPIVDYDPPLNGVYFEEDVEYYHGGLHKWQSQKSINLQS